MAISTNVYATVFAVPWLQRLQTCEIARAGSDQAWQPCAVEPPPVRTLVFTARLTYIMMSTSPAPTVAGFSLGPFHFPVADQAEWAERLAWFQKLQTRQSPTGYALKTATMSHVTYGRMMHK